MGDGRRTVAHLGIVAPQLAAVALFEVGGDGVEEVDEVVDGLGAEIVGQPLRAQRA